MDPRVHFHPLPISAPYGYYLNVRALRRALAEIQPALLHAHYASGYGTLGRWSGFHPFVLSVWGSDVYDFPSGSRLHRYLIVKNLRAADWVCSTSEVMARQTRRLWDVDRLSVIPFGIDTNMFVPRSPGPERSRVTIGTVKALAAHYGIDLLIRAFARVRERLRSSSPEIADRLHLLIVGGGPDQEVLETLVRVEGLSAVVEFTGPVPHEQVPNYLQRLDIYVAPSRLESFGVAVVEASASGLPVVVSDVGGLAEVVVNGVTGRIVPRESVDATASAIEELIRDPDLARAMGTAGRRLVLDRYEWSENVTQMERVYRRLLASSSTKPSRVA